MADKETLPKRLRKKLSFNLLMLKLQNTSLQEIKPQRIQESWKIPSSKKTGTMEGAAQEAPSTAGHPEMVGACPATGNDYWSLHTSLRILGIGSLRNFSP